MFLVRTKFIILNLIPLPLPSPRWGEGYKVSGSFPFYKKLFHPFGTNLKPLSALLLPIFLDQTTFPDFLAVEPSNLKLRTVSCSKGLPEYAILAPVSETSFVKAFCGTTPKKKIFATFSFLSNIRLSTRTHPHLKHNGNNFFVFI